MSNQEGKFEHTHGGEGNYQKPRLFVRELSGFSYTLAKQLKELRSVPRVIKGKDLKFNKGPQYYNANILTPSENMAQALYAHMVVVTPGGISQKHGHVNEAIFYILDGEGYDIHDGKRNIHPPLRFFDFDLCFAYRLEILVQRLLIVGGQRLPQ